MKVLEGKDGWLFLDNDTNRALLQHEGKLNLDDKQLNIWTRQIELRNAWVERNGGQYIFGVAPDTHAIYPEYLPESISPSDARAVYQLERALNSRGLGSIFVYPLEEIKASKPAGLVCNKTDSHWTRLGGLVFYQAVMTRVAKASKILQLEDFARLDINIKGDLGEKLEPPRASSAPQLTLNARTFRVIFDNKIINRGRIIIYENDKKDLPTCVMFRDSYGIQVLDMFAESFSRLVAVHSAAFDYNLVENERPDVVIGEIAERFLITVPDDLRDPTAQEVAVSKGYVPDVVR